MNLAVVNSAAVNIGGAGGARILLDHVFLQIRAEEWDCRITW